MLNLAVLLKVVFEDEMKLDIKDSSQRLEEV